MALASIQSAYSYYLSTYAHNTAGRQDTHKKSELRNIYHNILKLNKEAPLYKVKNNGEVQTFAIDIKENAKHIQNVIASLSGSEDIMKAFQKKSATSSNSDIVKAKYIGDSKEVESTEEFEIEVKQLAKSQINIGNFLDSASLDLAPDSYSFDLETNVNAYEFQFNINADDTNISIQQRLAKLITNAGIGLTASVLEDTYGRSSLRIESNSTGLIDGEEYLFKISAAGTSHSASAIETLGIDQISQSAQNSSFLLNNQPSSSYSNTFSINNTFELTLSAISQPDNPITIGFIADADAVADNVAKLVDSYNNILKTADTYSNTRQQSKKLFHDMSRAGFEHKDELAAIGLDVNKDGTININNPTLLQTIRSEDANEQFQILNSFKQQLNAKASYAVLNPMEYVDKVMIAYKNPGKNFSTPYVSSIYSGMMMDHYC